MKRFQRIYPAVFALALTAFSVYALLDTFVIEHVYAVSAAPAAVEAAAPAQSPVTLSAGNAEPAEPVITPTSYVSDELTVELTTVRWNDTDVHVADVTFTDPAALQTAFARSSYGRNVTAATSETAQDVDAVLAVNGDNYGARQTGYVIRGGVLYRDTAAKSQEDLVIWADGSASRGAQEVFSFGPGLVSDGEITVSEEDEVGRAKASNPRTAIGWLDTGHVVLVVSDGRTGDNEGLSLYELAAFLHSLGVETAYNLDGGGSSTMVFNGEVINTPTGGRGGHGSGERAVTDILYF